MKFSFVIPVYKTERFLPRCLESLRAQTVRDFEAVVVDDCSPGECADAVRPFGDFARYVRHDRNRGCFQARVTGLRHAQGDYVVPLDPDDWMKPDALAKISEAVGRDRPDVVSFGFCYDDGRRQWPHWCRPKAGVVSAGEFLDGIAGGRFTWSIVSKAVRRDVYLRAMDAMKPGDAYVNTSEDFFNTLPALICSETVSVLDYVGYVYFQNGASISATRTSMPRYRQSCEETRTAHETVRRMAAETGGDGESLRRIERVAERCVRFLVDEVVHGVPADIAAKSAVLADVFDAEVVAAELAEQLQAVRQSRAYRGGNAIAQLPRSVRSFAAALFGKTAWKRTRL